MKKVAQDDTGSLMVAVLMSVVGMLMSAVLATIVLGQIVGTRNAVQRQHAIDAALAGLDIATGHLRAAGDAQGRGSLSQLPCGSPTFTGSVGAGGGGVATYSVTITYLTSAGATVTCTAGAGTATAPATATVVSVGVDRSGNPRTLQATYRFRTTNQNIAGGQIHVYQVAGNPDLCMDGGSATPATGAALKVQPCDAGNPQQIFAYNTNLTLSLVSSATAGQPQGMCLDAGVVPHTVNNAAVTFQPCASTTQPRQQWSFNDNANFMGTSSNGQSLDGYCFNVQTPGSAGSPIVLRTGNNKCYGNGVTSYDNEQNFSPDRQVGAGAASAATQQLVNYYEFGRCLDVRRGNWASAYMIVWPCKQSPSGNQVSWNQKWQLPAIAAGSSKATGVISTQPSSETFSTCLVSPLSTAPGAYVILSQCPAGAPPPNMTWTVYGDTGVYATAFTITDSGGRCFAPTDPDVASPDVDTDGDKVSKGIVVNCSGSTLEKWNAPPYVLQPGPLKNIGEK